MASKSELLNKVEQILLNKYNKKGFISEDEIIDTCIDYDLDVIDIDSLCDKLLNGKVLVNDSISNNHIDFSVEDDFVDRSHIDYDEFYRLILKEHPEMEYLIENIKSVLPPQSREWQNLLPQAQNGNQYARDRLITMYARTVLKNAYTYAKSNYCDFEDCFQDGIIGLISAIEKYDLSSSDSFVGYYSFWAYQAMSRYEFPICTSVRYPVHIRDKFINIFKEATCYLEEDNDIERAIQEAFSDQELMKYEIDRDLLESLLPPIEFGSLFEEDNILDDKFISENSVEKIIEDNALVEEVKLALGVLKIREQQVIRARYGFEDGESKTLEEVGNKYGVTRERIRQIEAKALKKLQSYTIAKKLRVFYEK